jgi:VWFA-related protein
MLLLSVALSAGAARPEDADSDADRFEESLEVRIREVEVFVTDKKGNPIKGLDKGDFKLFENKIPLEILNFYSMDGGKRIDPGSGDPSLLDESTGGTPAAGSGRPPLNLIVYVDNYNLRPFSRSRIFESLKSTLGDLVRGSDRVMVVSFDRGLNIRQPFTSDMELVRKAIEEVEQVSAFLNYRDDERRDLLREIADTESGSVFMESLVGQVEAYAYSVEQDVRYTLGAMKYFVGALAGINGRKALLYVSDGLPMVAGEELFYALEERVEKAAAETGDGLGSRNRGLVLRSSSHDSHNLFDDLAAFASANKVTFYTVDAGGLRGNENIDVVNRSSSFTTNIGTIAERNLQSSLKYMAEQTGGRAFTNTNNFDQALELVFADMDSYYSLGYKPIYSADNPYFKIKVKMNRRGLNARHRKISLHKGLGAEMTDGIRATLLFGQPDNTFGVRMAFGDQEMRGKDDFLVPLVVAVPMESLFFKPGTGFHECQVSLSLAARDKRGWMSTVSEMPVPPPIHVPDESLDEARAGFFFYKMLLSMKGGSQTVAVGVRDETTAITSFTAAAVELGEDSEEQE